MLHTVYSHRGEHVFSCLLRGRLLVPLASVFAVSVIHVVQSHKRLMEGEMDAGT